MSELDTVVSVTITANTVTPTRAGFGTAMLLGHTSVFADDYRIYTDLSGMTADGFATKDELYQKASAMFSQSPRPERVFVARMTSNASFTHTLTVSTATAGLHIKVDVFDPSTGAYTTIDRTIPGASNTTAEATAVAALIDALPGVAATAASAVVTITPAVAGTKTSMRNPVNCTITETTADAGYDDRLAALQLINDEWYAVSIDSDSDANVQAVATWVESQKKLFFWGTNDSRELATSGSVTGAALKAAARKRTAGLWAADPKEHGQDAWLGVGLPQTPGSITWANKRLAGVTATSHTTTQKANLELANVNHYMPVAGVNITRPSKVASGEFIDIVHGLDALEADIQESAFSVLVNNGKIGYTAGALDLIANAILGALRRFEGDQALLVPGSSTVTMPAVSSISLSDKQNRRLTNVKFSATLQGAVHTMSIVGTVSL